ncbi:MAG: matrixin family metalloprotease [Actinomycetales bacterium]
MVRRSPSGRIPQWVMDEALGLPDTAPSWRGGAVDTAARPGHRRRPNQGRSGTYQNRRRRVGRWLGVSALAVTLVAGAVWAQTSGPASPPQAGHGAMPVPTPGREAADAPLGEPAPVAVPGDAWRPLRTQADGSTPVAWDPCRPIHYVTRPDAAPDGAAQALQLAIAQVSSATGLQFIDDGISTEGTSASRELFQPERYGDRWAPVLISYVSTAEAPNLAGGVVGQAGPDSVTVLQPTTWDRLTRQPGEPTSVYVSGIVQIDAVQAREILAGPDGQRAMVAVFEHELGHLVGLAHVDDPNQLMYPETRQQRGYASGDLTGLAAVGSGRCVPEV